MHVPLAHPAWAESSKYCCYAVQRLKLNEGEKTLYLQQPKLTKDVN